MAEKPAFYVNTDLLEKGNTGKIEKGSHSHLACLDMIAYKTAELGAKELSIDHISVLNILVKNEKVDPLSMSRNREYDVCVHRMATALDRMTERQALLPGYGDTLSMLSSWVSSVEKEDGQLVSSGPGKVAQKSTGATLDDWLEKNVN